MNRHTLIKWIRVIHFSIVHLASLSLGGFFWFTFTMMIWRAMPEQMSALQRAIDISAPFVVCLGVHIATIGYLGLLPYLSKPRSLAAALAGAALTVVLMTLGDAHREVVETQLSLSQWQGVTTTALYFTPGWILVQWIRPKRQIDASREAIRIPVTMAFSIGAVGAAVAYFVVGTWPATLIAMVAVAAPVFLLTNWIYNGSERPSRSVPDSRADG